MVEIFHLLILGSTGIVSRMFCKGVSGGMDGSRVMILWAMAGIKISFTKSMGT